MRIYLLIFISLCLMISALSCGDDSKSSNPSNEIPVTLDKANRVSKEITRDGGTLTTIDSDGTLYSLEIPADAFLVQDEVTITMTPITSVSSLPIEGNFVVGVRLQPNSLQFIKSAVLIIQPLFTPVPDNTIGIVYRGLNKDYYTYPLFSIEEPNSTVTFHITHFSDWIALTSDFCPQISAPSFTQDIYKNALACTLITGGVDPSIAYPILLDWFTNFVFPSLESASDLVSLDQSILRYTEWSEHVIWFNLFEQFVPQHDSAKSEIQYIIDQLLIEMDIKCRQPNTVCEKETIFLDADKLYRRAQQILGLDVEMTVPDIHVFCENLSEGIVQSVEVGLSGNLKPGETIDLIAVLQNAINQQIYNYDGTVSWSSSDEQIARIETTYINEYDVNAATFMLLSEGKVDIIAVAGCDKHDTISITVENPVPSEVVIAPNPVTISVDDNLSLNVTVRDQNGISLGGCPSSISWSILPEGIIAFEPTTKNVTGISEGIAEITATCEGASGDTQITVKEKTQSVGSVGIHPSSSTISVNDTLPLNVTVRDLNGIDLGGCPSEFSWQIPSGGIISFDIDSQVVTGVSEGGPVTITAICEENSGSATVTVQTLPCNLYVYQGTLPVAYNCTTGVPPEPCTDNWTEMGPSGTYDTYVYVRYCPGFGYYAAEMVLSGDIYYSHFSHTSECVTYDRSLEYHDIAGFHLAVSGFQLSGSSRDSSGTDLYGWTTVSFYGSFTESNVNGSLVFDWYFPFICSQSFDINLDLYLIEEWW